MIDAQFAYCTGCDKQNYLIPLHGDKGGPLRCFRCSSEWHAKHSRRRKWGRIVIKAMKMYLKEGGKYNDLDKLKLHASGLSGFDGFSHLVGLSGYEDTIGTEVGDITSELLAETIRLTHPDRHAPEHQELATRVTQELTVLRPFVFPRPKPKPAAPAPQPRDASSKVSAETSKKPPRVWPCELCAETVPYFYCNPCKAEWDKRRQTERERERAKQRKWYSWRRKRRLRQRPARTCTCGEKITSNRSDTKFCSAACKQKAYRKRVTAKSRPHGEIIKTRNAEARP